MWRRRELFVNKDEDNSLDLTSWHFPRFLVCTCKMGRFWIFFVLLEVLSDEAELVNRARYLDLTSLWFYLRVLRENEWLSLKEGITRLWAFLKLTKLCAHELILLISLLPSADLALLFEEVARSVTDESQVQKHNDSKYTEAANLLCHCRDEMFGRGVRMFWNCIKLLFL